MLLSIWIEAKKNPDCAAQRFYFHAVRRRYARLNRYEHPWLVVDRDGWRTAGCWSRAEARKLWTQWRLQTEEDNVVGEVGDELNEDEDWRYFSDS